jgi:hypothetical protein
MATAKYWENIIVFVLLEGYLKLKKQENSETFVFEKKKCRICLLLTFNGSNCGFLTTKLITTEIHLKSHSNKFKSNVMKLDKIFEKLNKKTKKYCYFEKKMIIKNIEV